jgi:hypothetical protein
MQRRGFIALVGGVAAWPVAGRAQHSEKVRRIGVLGGYAANDPEVAPRVAALRQGLDGHYSKRPEQFQLCVRGDFRSGWRWVCR